MGCLGRRPERQFTADGVAGIWFPLGNTGMRFDGRVIIAFVVEPIFANVICRGKSGIDLAKFVGDRLVNVADTRFVVDLDFGMCQRFIDTHDRSPT